MLKDHSQIVKAHLHIQVVLYIISLQSVELGGLGDALNLSCMSW